jgi:hypothetical protein
LTWIILYICPKMNIAMAPITWIVVFSVTRKEATIGIKMVTIIDILYENLFKQTSFAILSSNSRLNLGLFSSSHMLLICWKRIQLVIKTMKNKLKNLINFSTYRKI